MDEKKYLDSVKLKEIINIDTLQTMQDKFAEATGMSAVIVNKAGCPITQYSNYTNYCRLIHSSPLGRKRCTECDMKLGVIATQSVGKIAWHICYAGLVDVSVPVIVNDIYIGQVMCGQVLFDEPKKQIKEDIWKLNQELGLSNDLLVKYFQEVKIVPKKRLLDSAELLTIISSYIVESGMNAIAQKELHEKEVQLVEMTSNRVKTEKTLKELELKTLQSQVNPHFLFNVLNTIARLAMFENADSTQEMTYNLAQLLRYSLRELNKPVTINDEINYVRNYLMIQSTRFGKRIKYRINIVPEIMDFQIPTMTFQPLVENAIVHGLEPKPEGGIISITGKKEGERVVIEILDTGVGISRGKIDKIFKDQIKGTGKGHSTAIGFLNVYKRLKHYFNDSCQLNVESREGYWTKIIITFPYIYK